ncbi:MAG: TIGR03663 family protein [Candidatus Methanoperedens sp.]|nr:TIGR03663 family protein [Candidatus Methanoperedens sp.]
MSNSCIHAFMIFKFPGKLDKTLIVFIFIAIAGFLLRLFKPAENPLDFDESIHAFTSFLLFKYNIYVYNPTTHGPFLYYMTAGIFQVLGDNILSARLFPALFGGGMVLLLFPLRRYFGDVKFLLISGMIAFSYSFITFSRQLRHDIFLAFFILAFIVCMILFFEHHSTLYLYSGSACLAITMAIKPTTYIFMFIIVYFLILNKNVFYRIYEELNTQTGKNNKISFIIIYIILIFISINYLFYNNLSDGFFKAIYNWVYQIYYPSGNLKEILFQPYYFYLINLLKFEFIIFITGLIGSIYYILLKDKSYFILFCSFWAILSLLIFSMIKYKTPDLILNIILPFIIVSGFFLGEIIERFFNKNRMNFTSIIIILLIVLVLINNPLLINSNNEYEEINQFIKINKGEQNDIYLVSLLGNFYTIQWPLPWYLREYNLLQADKGYAIELNYLFNAKYSDNAKDFVHPYKTKGVIISSTNITNMGKFGYNNSKRFEKSGVYIYY